MPISFAPTVKNESDKRRRTRPIFAMALLSEPPGGIQAARSLPLNNTYQHRKVNEKNMSTASIIFLVMMLIGIVIGIRKARRF